MPGQADPRNFEQIVNETENVDGVLTDLPIPLGAWTLAAGTPFIATTTGIVGAGATNTNMLGLVWNATADTGDIASLNIPLPGNFRSVDGVNFIPRTAHWSEFQLQVFARKLDITGSATENATLALTGDMYWQNTDPNVATNPSDTSDNHLTTPASALLSPKTFSQVSTYAWYTLDIGARIQAESKILRKHAACQINLSVSAAVGTALAVEVRATRLRFRTHVALTNRSDRFRTMLLGSLATGLVGSANVLTPNV